MSHDITYCYITEEKLVKNLHVLSYYSKIEASTIEQFFLASGERSEDLRALTRLITEEISENPKLTHGMGTITMLGWKFIDYKPKSAPKSTKPFNGQ